MGGTQLLSGRFGVFSSCRNRQCVFGEGCTKLVGRFVLEMEKRCIETRKEGRNILHRVKRRNVDNIGHILCKNFLLKQVIEEEIERRIQGKRRRGRRRKHLLDRIKK